MQHNCGKNVENMCENCGKNMCKICGKTQEKNIKNRHKNKIEYKSGKALEIALFVVQRKLKKTSKIVEKNRVL